MPRCPRPRRSTGAAVRRSKLRFSRGDGLVRPGCPAAATDQRPPTLLIAQQPASGARDSAGAISWYSSAAAQGLPEAALNLGYLYERGVGVPADMIRAQQYYLQAAEKGLGAAQLNLGLLLSARKDDRAARSEAVYWLTLAADQGVPDAAEARDVARSVLSGEELARVRKRLNQRAALKN